MNIFQRLMAHGFAGCLMAILGAFVLGGIAYSTEITWDSPSPNTAASGWMQHGSQWIMTVAFKFIYVGAGVLLGSVLGFFAGALINIALVRVFMHRRRAQTRRRRSSPTNRRQATHVEEREGD
jgi:hypothetical protein